MASHRSHATFTPGNVSNVIGGHWSADLPLLDLLLPDPLAFNGPAFVLTPTLATHPSTTTLVAANVIGMEGNAQSDNENHGTGVQHVMIPDEQGIPRSWTVLRKPTGLANRNLQEEMGLADEPGDDTEAGTQIYRGIWRKVRYEFNAAMPSLDNDYPPLWKDVSSSVKSRVNTSVTTAKPYMRRFAGGWATEAIMLDVLRNARDTAARRRAGKLRARGAITGKRSKSNMLRAAAKGKQKAVANTTRRRGNPPDLDAPGLHSIPNDPQPDADAVPPNGANNGTAPASSGEPASNDSGVTWNTYVDQELAEIRASRPTPNRRKNAGSNPAVSDNAQGELLGDPDVTALVTRANGNNASRLHPRPRPRLGPPTPQRGRRVAGESKSLLNMLSL